jgi:putative inorganic carbon (HCO3(-)) transporter
LAYLFTLLYIALALLSPKDLIPSLVEYRLELVVVALAVSTSMFRLFDGKLLRTPQTYLLGGLCTAVVLSIAIGEHWPGGGVVALQKFLPASIVFFLVVLNCQSIRKLQGLVWLIAFIAVLYIGQGAKAYYAGERNIDNVCRPVDTDVPKTTRLTNVLGTPSICNPLLDVIPLSDGTFAFRMQGLGFLRDPNEFAQLLVLIVPLLWIGWKSSMRLQNILFVLLPSVLLIWGIYLTHSRGAMIALLVILMLAVKNRAGWTKTILAAGLAFAFMTVLNFSGGREISLQAGSNRFMLWGDGLALFKASPLFGVGYENFATANQGQTAHNSFVVCLAELGLFGYAFWVALLVYTLAELKSLRSFLQPKIDELSSNDEQNDETRMLNSQNRELRRWAEGVQLSIAGFLAAAFFLSRAYALTLYLILGVAVAVAWIASDEAPPIRQSHLLRRLVLSAGVGFATITLVYITLRFANAFALDKSGGPL